MQKNQNFHLFKIPLTLLKSKLKTLFVRYACLNHVICNLAQDFLHFL